MKGKKKRTWQEENEELKRLFPMVPYIYPPAIQAELDKITASRAKRRAK